MFYVYLSNVDIFILTESNAVTKSPMGILFGNDVCVCVYVFVYVCAFLKMSLIFYSIFGSPFPTHVI